MDMAAQHALDIGEASAVSSQARPVSSTSRHRRVERHDAQWRPVDHEVLGAVGRQVGMVGKAACQHLAAVVIAGISRQGNSSLARSGSAVQVIDGVGEHAVGIDGVPVGLALGAHVTARSGPLYRSSSSRERSLHLGENGA